MSCEELGGVDVRFTTYNVLAPRLSDPKHFPKCPPGTTEHEARLPKLMLRMTAEVESGAIIGLQEVDLAWAGRLHAFFAEHGYCAVFAQYGKQFNGYMGVMMAWPRDKFEALDVDISRISDTAPPDMWPREQNSGSGLTPFGNLTYFGLKAVLGCNPPQDVLNRQEALLDKGVMEWKLAKSRFNEAVFVRLRPRGQPGSKSFCVGTYHMPCLFGSAEKVRVVNIHMFLLLHKLKAFAGGDPAVLMGDFNFTPTSSPYALALSGGSIDKAAATNAEELAGLSGRLPAKVPFPGGMASAYRSFHGGEPAFTNFAQTQGQEAPFIECLDYIWFSPGQLSVVDCPKLPQARDEVAGPFPNVAEPSDHLPLHATLRLGGAGGAGAPRARL